MNITPIKENTRVTINTLSPTTSEIILNTNQTAEGVIIYLECINISSLVSLTPFSSFSKVGNFFEHILVNGDGSLSTISIQLDQERNGSKVRIPIATGVNEDIFKLRINGSPNDTLKIDIETNTIYN